MLTAQAPAWERPLLAWALEGQQSWPLEAPAARATAPLLNRAYAHCDSVAATYGRSFYLATRLLPPAKRRAMRALYAFCRVSDNLVDTPGPDPGRALDAWRQHTCLTPPPATEAAASAGQALVATAWADTRARYHIPLGYAAQLIAGVAHDLQPARYPTFADLAAYAYGVASTVGLMSMHIIGYAGPAAIPYAVELGVALQLTNILRDVGEDWRAGRVYLPLDELAAFGLDEADLAGGAVDDRWRAFMRFQIARTRRLYATAWPGIALLHKDGRLAVAAASDLYRAILAAIEANDYDVFHRRAAVGAWAKLRRLPGLWWRSR